MSGYYGELERGKPVKHKGRKKIVKDWFFIGDPDGLHNSDIIVIRFKDGTNTGDEGFSNIKYDGEK